MLCTSSAGLHPRCHTWKETLVNRLKNHDLKKGLWSLCSMRKNKDAQPGEKKSERNADIHPSQKSSMLLPPKWTT